MYRYTGVPERSGIQGYPESAVYVHIHIGSRKFCNSQCLSHFAAPFIVVRAETSVAESCPAL